MKENDNAKIDYEAMLEAALTKMKNMIDAEKQYFDVLARVNKCSDIIKLVSTHCMEMDISDQILLMRAVIQQGEICKALQAKYNFEEDV